MCFWRCFVNCKHTWQCLIRNPSSQPHSNPHLFDFHSHLFTNQNFIFYKLVEKFAGISFVDASYLFISHCGIFHFTSKFLRFSFCSTVLSYLHRGKVAHHQHDGSSWILYRRDEEMLENSWEFFFAWYNIWIDAHNLFGLTTNTGENYQLSVVQAKAHNTRFYLPIHCLNRSHTHPRLHFVVTNSSTHFLCNNAWKTLLFSLYHSRQISMYCVWNTSISSSSSTIKSDRKEEWMKKTCQNGKY